MELDTNKDLKKTYLTVLVSLLKNFNGFLPMPKAVIPNNPQKTAE
jgi:hypothetical protein